MAKGESPLQLSQGWRAPGRKEKARGGTNRKKWIIQGRESRGVIETIITGDGSGVYGILKSIFFKVLLLSKGKKRLTSAPLL